MNIYYYVDKDDYPIRIRAKRKPNARRDTWVIQEFVDGKWSMPCFPEITWRLLNTFTYVGSTKVLAKEEAA